VRHVPRDKPPAEPGRQDWYRLVDKECPRRPPLPSSRAGGFGPRSPLVLTHVSSTHDRRTQRMRTLHGASGQMRRTLQQSGRHTLLEWSLGLARAHPVVDDALMEKRLEQGVAALGLLPSLAARGGAWIRSQAAKRGRRLAAGWRGRRQPTNARIRRQPTWKEREARNEARCGRVVARLETRLARLGVRLAALPSARSEPSC